MTPASKTRASLSKASETGDRDQAFGAATIPSAGLFDVETDEETEEEEEEEEQDEVEEETARPHAPSMTRERKSIATEPTVTAVTEGSSTKASAVTTNGHNTSAGTTAAAAQRRQVDGSAAAASTRPPSSPLPVSNGAAALQAASDLRASMASQVSQSGPLVRIMFTGDVPTQAELEFIEQADGEVTENPFLATHCVCNKLRRTEKFMIAMSVVPHIVLDSWLADSRAKGRFIELPPDGQLTEPWQPATDDALVGDLNARYRLRDRSGEKKFGVSLASVLPRRNLDDPVFTGYTVHISSSVKGQQSMRAMAEAAGATVRTLLQIRSGHCNVLAERSPWLVYICKY